MDPAVIVRILLHRQEQLFGQLPEPARAEHRRHALALRLTRNALHLGLPLPPALERYVRRLAEGD